MFMLVTRELGISGDERLHMRSLKLAVAHLKLHFPAEAEQCYLSILDFGDDDKGADHSQTAVGLAWSLLSCCFDGSIRDNTL